MNWEDEVVGGDYEEVALTDEEAEQAEADAVEDRPSDEDAE